MSVVGKRTRSAHDDRCVSARKMCSICCEYDGVLLPCESCKVYTCLSCVKRRGTHPYDACFTCAQGKLAAPDQVSPYFLETLLSPWPFRDKTSMAELLAVWSAPAPAPSPSPSTTTSVSYAPAPAPSTTTTTTTSVSDALLDREMALFVDNVSLIRCTCGVRTPVTGVNLSMCIDLTCACGHVLCALCSFESCNAIQARHHAFSAHKMQFVSREDYVKNHVLRVQSGLISLSALRNMDEELFTRHPRVEAYVRDLCSSFGQPLIRMESYKTLIRYASFDIWDLLTPEQRAISVSRLAMMEYNRANRMNGDGVMALTLREYMNSASSIIECAKYWKNVLRSTHGPDEAEKATFPLSVAVYVELARNMEQSLFSMLNTNTSSPWERFRFKFASSALFNAAHTVLGPHLVHSIPRNQRANLFGLASILRRFAGSYCVAELDATLLQVDDVDVVGSVHPDFALHVWDIFLPARIARINALVESALHLEEKRIDMEHAVGDTAELVSEYARASSDFRTLMLAGRYAGDADLGVRRATEFRISSQLIQDVLNGEDAAAMATWHKIVASGLPISIVNFEAVLRRFSSSGMDVVSRAFHTPSIGFTVAQREFVLFLRDVGSSIPSRESLSGPLRRVYEENERTYGAFDAEELCAYKKLIA